MYKQEKRKKSEEKDKEGKEEEKDDDKFEKKRRNFSKMENGPRERPFTVRLAKLQTCR